MKHSFSSSRTVRLHEDLLDFIFLCDAVTDPHILLTHDELFLYIVRLAVPQRGYFYMYNSIIGHSPSGIECVPIGVASCR